nr:MAG TPA: hypothetical protein [Caudoviricetes sp.]
MLLLLKHQNHLILLLSKHSDLLQLLPKYHLVSISKHLLDQFHHPIGK